MNRAHPVARNGQRFALVLDKAIQNQHEVARLCEHIRLLQQANNRLRRSQKLLPHVRIVHVAHDTALKLAALHLAGFLSGRDVVYDTHHIAIRSWYYGRALLIAARVHNGISFTTSDPQTIEHNLTVAAQACRRDIDVLLRHIPLSRRPKLPRRR